MVDYKELSLSLIDTKYDGLLLRLAEFRNAKGGWFCGERELLLTSYMII